MFCTKCGAEIPEGAKFCISCGAPSDSTAQPPVQPAQPAAPAAPVGTPVSKAAYFWKAGSASTRVINIVSIVVGLLCLLLLYLPVNIFLNGPFYEIPILKLMDGTDGIYLDDMKDEYEEMLELFEDADDDDELEYIFEREFNISVDELEDDFDITVKEFVDLLDPISITNLMKLMAVLDGDEEVLVIFRIIRTAIYVVFAILMLITALGVGFQKTWVMIVAYVLSFGFVAFMGGFVFWLLATIAYIAAAVLYSKLNGAYKLYRKSFEA